LRVSGRERRFGRTVEKKELFLQNLSGGTEMALAILEKKIKTEKRKKIRGNDLPLFLLQPRK
jgi:hypothetical protein